MRQDLIKLSAALLTAVTMVGCGGGSSDVNRTDTTQPGDDGDTIHRLTPQSGTQSKLFYGNSKHNALGSLSNSRVIDSSDSSKVLVSRDSIDVRYPGINTSLTYGENGSYSDLYTQSISYVSESKPYTVSMTKESGTESANSSAGNLDKFSYKKISYLGAKQYLTVTNEAGDQLLITPEMGATDTPLAFKDKTLLTLSYKAYGSAVNGYIVYDSNTSQLQNCSTDMATCQVIIADINATPIFLGDIGGTVKSILSVDNKPYVIDKSLNSASKIAGVTLPVKVGHGSPYALNDDNIYYVENGNIFKVDLNGTVTQLSADEKADGFDAFTEDMVVYGGDDYMYAVKKDGSLKDAPIELSVTTKTRGQKYPFNLGIGKQYLYTTYSVDTTTGKNTFYACKLEDSKIDCKEDSYWSAVTASKDGTLNFKSTYIYTPYAYIRVDTADSDNYGGGKVKAIDPKYPLEDGITMGSIETYNFQTFVNSRYDDDMIDSEGNIVLYAKNDLNFRGDAFLMNLTKENTLANLTKEASPEVNGAINAGRDHCHGRKCTVCHSFAGGKIYVDKEGTASAKNHNIRFEFEDGSDSILAKIRKGSGENFNTPLENLVGKNFKAVVVDENKTAVVSSIGYYHKGVEYFNCNYCHGRRGDLKHDAPNVITIED